MNRRQRSSIARQTLEILERGVYQDDRGQKVLLCDEQARAEAGTTLHTPESLDELVRRLQDAAPPYEQPAEVTLRNETTLKAAQRLTLREGETSVMLLNFASARNPGGGFLGGSQAQEESLARSSGLYPCLTTQRHFYDLHRGLPSGLYTDHMIHSPQVPFFRTDDGALLEAPYLASVITSPAVNAGVVKRKGKVSAIRATMERRARKVLALSAAQGHEVLVLGAWGCGVFRNDPKLVADLFGRLLQGEEGWGCWFRRVAFAVLDNRHGHIFNAFQQALYL